MPDRALGLRYSQHAFLLAERGSSRRDFVLANAEFKSPINAGASTMILSEALPAREQL